jgi:cytochrome P450 family 142 subfamily A polypeptide 1
MKIDASNVDCNFAAPDSWDDDVHARFQWLRENEPVYWSKATEIWMITDFENCSVVSKDQGRFTSEFGVRPKEDTIIGLIDEGEPRHGALRKLINKGFSPRMVKKLEVEFRKITEEAIDEVAKQSECDFATAIAVPLPIRLIAKMLGVPDEDRDLFHQWSDDLIAADGNHDKPEIMARSSLAFVEYTQYVTKIIEERRKKPEDDLISILAGAKDDGLLKNDFHVDREREGQTDEHNELANDELLILLVVLMVAGNETTRNGISGGMEYLIKNPGERQKLIDDPSLIPSAVEEMVRLVSPVRTFARTVVDDTELAGHQLKKGQQVYMVYPSANRDAKAFDDPEEFRIDRNPNHLGFGVGSHFCLGANLARMEMRVAFEEVLRRLPDMEFSRGGPEFRASTLVRSLMHMWVKYTPESA